MERVDARGLSCPEPVILTRKALQSGADMNKLFNLPVREKIARMGMVSEKDLGQIDALEDEMKNEIAQLLAAGGDK